jgi:hypothetical protein
MCTKKKLAAIRMRENTPYDAWKIMHLQIFYPKQTQHIFVLDEGRMRKLCSHFNAANHLHTLKTETQSLTLLNIPLLQQ